MFDLLFPSRLLIILLPNIMYYFLFLTMLFVQAMVGYQESVAMMLAAMKELVVAVVA